MALLSYAGKHCGTFTVSAEELDEGQKESVFFVCHGRSLDKKDLFGKSDPFLEFYRCFDDGRLVTVFISIFCLLVSKWFIERKFSRKRSTPNGHSLK